MPVEERLERTSIGESACTPEQELNLLGVAIVRGIAIGVPFVLATEEDAIEEITLPEDAIDNEIMRYHEALEKSREDILRLKSDLTCDGIKDGVSVLDAHLQITQDPLLNECIEDKIRTKRANAESVFHSAIKEFREKFAALKDPFFQSRFEDIQDISKRVLAYLHGARRVKISDAPDNAIIFSYTLTPSEVAEAKRSAQAFVTQVGGQMSHTAIVAKARGIPFVSHIQFSQLQQATLQQQVIVDGLNGKIILNPSRATLNKYNILKSHIDHQKANLDMNASAQTVDGHIVRLTANVEIADDFSLLSTFGAEGVGLFRSEYIVLQRGYFPSEEEQYAIYKDLVEHAKNNPVVIRAFDIGLDKVVCSLQGRGELNPALGLRAIRFLLHERELFRTQMCAILRASAHGDVRILFPMISCMNELYEAKQIVQSAKEELKREGRAFNDAVKIGCMIEVPSAAMIVDLIADACDFLSIGTNDLTQYSLAVDRANQSTNALYTAAHPGVLRLIQKIVTEAKAKNIPVSVCGEVASDPRFVPFLIGLGICELSVSCRHLPIIRHVVRHTKQSEAIELVKKLMRLTMAQEIQAELVHEYEKNIPPGTIDHL